MSESESERFAQAVRDAQPTCPVYRLDFDSPERLNEALPWMLWVKRPAPGEMVVRKGVTARGFEEQGRAVLIVGGELTAEERQQLARIARRFHAVLTDLTAPVVPVATSEDGAPTAGSGRRRLRALVAWTAGVIVVGGALVLWAHRSPYTPIGTIRLHVSDYDGKVVTVRGRVAGASNLMGVSAYRLQDDTGQIAVVTGGEIPEVNTARVVKGQVVAAFVAGPVTSLALVEQSSTPVTPGSASRSE